MMMTGFLFDKIVFGPIHSRRMGSSLGINLLPLNAKCCSFNCIYCECGWTSTPGTAGNVLPASGEVAAALEQKLTKLSSDKRLPDAITFAGNGEPTLHPEFAAIIEETVRLRNLYAPGVKISVLSNGSRLHVPEVFSALLKVDMNIQKLDAGTVDTIRLINQPHVLPDLPKLIDRLRRFQGLVIIQTLFLKGEYQGKSIDNTTEKDMLPWIGYLKQIRPQYVMIYSLDRATPASGLIKLHHHELAAIAERVEKEGIPTRVFD